MCLSLDFSAVNPEPHSTFLKKKLFPLSGGGFLSHLMFSQSRKPFENKFRTRNLAILLISAQVHMSCFQRDGHTEMFIRMWKSELLNVT